MYQIFDTIGEQDLYMKILQCNLSNQDKILTIVVKVLKQGGLVVVPTDTVYGLAVDALNQQAVDKLIVFKSRPHGKPISVFVKDLTQLNELASVKPNQQLIIERLLPGPFTLILPSKKLLAQGLSSERGTIGVRIPNFDFINRLTFILGIPITATSANMSDRSPHYSIDSLLKEIPAKVKSLIDLIVDFGKLPINKPSTVVDLISSQVQIIRRGDFAFLSQKSNVFFSKTPSETKKIARSLFGKYSQNIDQKPLIFLLEGEFGVGKTIFVKGIGEVLGIKDIVSPTFVIYYEYKTETKKLFHFDLYNIAESKELKNLSIEQILSQNVVICIEWGEKSGEIFDLLKRKGKIIYIKITYKTEKERKLEVFEN